MYFVLNKNHKRYYYNNLNLRIMETSKNINNTVNANSNEISFFEMELQRLQKVGYSRREAVEELRVQGIRDDYSRGLFIPTRLRRVNRPSYEKLHMTFLH